MIRFFGKKDQSIEEVLTSHFNKKLSLTKEERLILTSYTDDYFSDIYESMTDNIELTTEVKHYIKLLDKITHKSKLPVSLKLYRGTNEERLQESIIKQGHIITNVTFYSTSIDKATANSFRKSSTGKGILLEFDIPAGYHGIWMKPLSSIPKEKEILLPRNEQFKIVERKKNLGTNKKYDYIKLVPVKTLSLKKLI